jgi:hypothetical protein
MLGKNVRSLQKLIAFRPINVSRQMSSLEPRTVTLIPGDGIGPEIAASVQK